MFQAVLMNSRLYHIFKVLSIHLPSTTYTWYTSAMSYISDWQTGILGHKAEMRLFAHAEETGRLSSVYLLTGQRAVGKATVARAFAAQLLQTTVANLNTHADFTSLEAGLNEKTGKEKESIGVETVEWFRERLEHSALHGGKKVALIEDADTLNVSAQNALLKTLEEPKGDTLIFLVAEHADKLLGTVRSRAEEVRFGTVTEEEICDAVKASGVSREEAHEVAGFAAGRPGIAIMLARDPSALREYRSERERVMKCLDPAFEKRLLAARGLLPTEEDHVKSRKLLIRRLEMLECFLRDEFLKGVGAASLSRDPLRSIRLTAVQAQTMLRRMKTARDDINHHIYPPLVLYQMLL